ncbi:MAG: hypothetical protein VYD85_11460, partial [Pseudomonadota bacterium]|nr:hypothetical protein [Pseudomonadota bacterium]
HGDPRFLGEVILIETVKSGDINRPRRRFRKKPGGFLLQRWPAGCTLSALPCGRRTFYAGSTGFVSSTPIVSDPLPGPDK